MVLHIRESFVHGQSFFAYEFKYHSYLDCSGAELYDIATTRNVKKNVHQIEILSLKNTFEWISANSIKQKLCKYGTGSKYNYNATQTTYARPCHQKLNHDQWPICSLIFMAFQANQTAITTDDAMTS